MKDIKIHLLCVAGKAMVSCRVGVGGFTCLHYGAGWSVMVAQYSFVMLSFFVVCWALRWVFTSVTVSFLQVTREEEREWL